MVRLGWLFLTFFCALPLHAAQRVALVIGNAGYQNGRLSNPVNDATDVASKLRTLGFLVISGTDLDRDAMLRKVQEFRAELTPGGVALFFYSGHGVEVAGRNYLLPVNNALIRTAEDAELHGLEAQRLVSQMEAAGSQLNVLILDACRDNPLPATVRSPSKGLAPMTAQQGTLIAYATREGMTAADGDGRNSPYTAALLKYLGETDLEVSVLFNRVGLAVAQATRNAQVPWVSSSPVPPVILAHYSPTATPERPEDDSKEPETVVITNPGQTSRRDGELTWAQSDNGVGINWRGAVDHCKDLGSGWRLPESFELVSLYDPGERFPQVVHGLFSVYPNSRDIELSGRLYWSMEEMGGDYAVVVNLGYGSRHKLVKSSKMFTRALCVRS